MPHPLINVGAFLVRHFLASCVVVVSACILWTVLYFALLLWAVVSGGGIGGPLAYPVGLLLVFVLAAIVTALLLWPSAALAEWIGRRSRLGILAQIPLSVAVLAVLSFTAAFIAHAFNHPYFAGRFLSAGAVVFIVHLVPLGIYWWAAQSGPLVISLFRRFVPDVLLRPRDAHDT